MTVTVRLYAGLRAGGPGGKGVLTLEVPEGVTIAGLFPRIGVDPAAVRRVFVNGIIRDESYLLQPGDELGVFPPIAGGALA